MIEAKDAEINFKDLPSIEGIPMLIYQLFYNLVLNSLKFAKTDVPSHIDILATKVVDDNVDFIQIQVADNGIGIDVQQAEAIFTPFIRLNSADIYEGSGLGLALCKKIVERHHGKIKATGELGKGTVITILLPYNKS